MKILKSIAFVAIAGATLFATTAGAASSSTPVNGQSNTAPVANSTPAASQSIKLQTMNLTQGVIGWLGNNKILFIKQNPDVWAVNPTNNSKYHPNNIYVRDVATGKDTLLASNKTGVGGVIPSPDQKYIFFIDDNGYNILNVSTGKTVNVAKVTFKTGSYASWSDNTHFIYSTNEGDIISLDVNGKSQTLLKTGQKRLGGGITVVGSIINYAYTAADNSVTFMSYNMQTKESTTFKDAFTINPAPNGSQLAMIKNGALVLTDLKGNVKSTIATGDQAAMNKNEQVIWTLWSPDGSKLAYSITFTSLKDGTATQTRYIYDVKTGKQSQVPIDKNLSGFAIGWSPSGQKILYPTMNGTYIASLS